MRSWEASIKGFYQLLILMILEDGVYRGQGWQGAKF